jgi:aerobic C4-dicarboxylate transport protein
MMRLLSKLYVQLLIGIAAGILVGRFFPAAGPHLKPLADVFIKLVRMLLAPIIFSTVVVGIARMGDIKSVGRLGLKALIYFELVSGLALIIGLVVVNVARPGAGMGINPATLDTSSIAPYLSAGHKFALMEFLLNIVPSSAGGAFVDGNILQVILLSLLFGIALSQVGARKLSLIDMLDTFLQAMFGIVRTIMYLAPLATFGSMAFIVGQYGPAKLLTYGKLIACVYFSCILFIFLVLGSIARVSGISLLGFLKYIRSEILITFGTCSTEAVLPQMMSKLEALGCGESLVGLVLPAGYTFNADGTSIYLTMAAIFVAQATGTPLTLWDQLTVLGVLLLTSKGSAGIAGAGFITLAATLASMDKIPVAGIVLLLAVESILNQARAVTNVIGNGVATVAIARWEGTLDVAKARQILERRKPAKQS